MHTPHFEPNDSQQVRAAKLNGLVEGIIEPSGTVYRAILNQSGTDAPVATVLENTIGSVLWSRADTGIYDAAVVGATSNNIWVQIAQGCSDVTNYVFQISPTNTGARIHTHQANSYKDGALDRSCVEIRKF